MTNEYLGRQITNRRTVLYLLVLMGTIIAGLYSRSELVDSSTLFGRFGGDILWASMVYWGSALLLQKSRRATVVIVSLLFCYGIEVSQLFHPHWLMALRKTPFGALVLGHSFLWSDFVSYSLGVAGAWSGDVFWVKRSDEV